MVEVLEHVIVEVLSIVNCDLSRDIVMTDIILSVNFFDGCGGYVGDGLRLNPFHEVLDSHDGEGIITLC
jgi:hypothetical protein